MAGSSPRNRPYNGTNNKAEHPRWGSAGERFVRMTRLGHADSVATPAGPNSPNARTISNRVCQQTGSIPDPRGLSDLVGLWSLFLSHMVNLFRGAQPEEDSNIPVPDGDPVFEPASFIPVFRWITGSTAGPSRLGVGDVISWVRDQGSHTRGQESDYLKGKSTHG